MRSWVLMIMLSLVVITTATADKNAGGALVVHTDDLHSWRYNPCSNFDYWVPQECEQLNTQTDKPWTEPVLIWFIAAFDATSSPGVTSIYFGNDHNLPPGEGYHPNWDFCGPAGSFELPDPGWPEDPLHAGNYIQFGSPIVGDRFFPIYSLNIYGYEGAYYASGINPILGYAAFVDDGDPPETDTIWRFGEVRWYEPGHNVCPGEPIEGLVACCFENCTCLLLTETRCTDLEGESLGPGSDCDPDPCPHPQCRACCLENGACRLKTPLDCWALGGMILGEETNCDPNPCPQPHRWACCLQTGGCRVVDTLSDCEALGGRIYGEEPVCDPNPCYGACCFWSGECQMREFYWCEPMGGEYMGGGTDCDPNPCEGTSSVPETSVREATWGVIKARYR